MSMYTLQTKYFFNLLEGKIKNNMNNIKYAIDTQKVIDAFFKSNKLKKIIKIT